MHEWYNYWMNREKNFQFILADKWLDKERSMNKLHKNERIEMHFE